MNYHVVTGTNPSVLLDANTRWVYLSRTNESINLRAGNAGSILAVIPKNGRGSFMLPQEITMLYCEFSETSTIPPENQEAIFIVADSPIRGDIHGDFYKIGDSDNPYSQAAFVGQSNYGDTVVSLGTSPMYLDWTTTAIAVAGHISPGLNNDFINTSSGITIPGRTITYYTNTGRTVFPRGNPYAVGAGGARLPMYDLATTAVFMDNTKNIRIVKCVVYIYDVSGTVPQLFGIDATYEPAGYVADSPVDVDSVVVDNLPLTTAGSIGAARRITGSASVWNNDNSKVIARQERSISNGGEYVFDLLSLPNEAGQESPVELQSNLFGRNQEKRFIVGFQCASAVTFRSLVHCVYTEPNAIRNRNVLWG